MPVVGLGSVFGFTPPGSTNITHNSTKLWLQNGGRSIHTAWMYCNQPAVGRAVKDFMEETGTPREAIFIESMLPPWHLGYNETLTSFYDTLQQLQTPYLDLYMFHWPGVFVSNLPMSTAEHPETCGIPVLDVPACKKHEASWKKCGMGSWQAMLELQEQGKIRALGTSNFEVAQLNELLHATPHSQKALAVNQVESHIGYHDDYLQTWCRAHGIQQQAYSPLGGGKLSKSSDTTVLAIAQKHNKSTAQIALRFLVQNGLSVIPKAGTTAYQLENMDLFSWSLEPEEMVSLGRLATPYSRGVSDGMSQMCVEESSGYMARCIYLDQQDDPSPFFV